MARVGIVGIGFMGWIHYLAYQRVRGMNVAAICTRDAKKRAGDWRGIQGNFGPPGEQIEMRGIGGYDRLDAMLADKSLDVIDICLPPALHAEATVAALKAGKHVFCEKPISVSPADARRMVEAAQQADRRLLIGHVLPFLPEFQFARQAILGGKYGKLLGAHFKRIISDPLWLPDFYDPIKVGGPLVDLHIHDAHFIRLICGLPQSVLSRGTLRVGVPEYVETQFVFADPNLVVSATSGVLRQPGRSFAHAFEIRLERATLLFDFAVIDGQGRTLQPLTVLTEKQVLQPRLAPADPIDGFVAEIRELQRTVKTGQSCELLSANFARDALMLCHKQTESIVKGRAVKV